MKILIHGKNLELTGALKEYTEAKIEKATHHTIRISLKKPTYTFQQKKIQESPSRLQKSQFLLMVLLFELKKKLKIYTQSLIQFQINFVENYVNTKKEIIRQFIIINLKIKSLSQLKIQNQDFQMKLYLKREQKQVFLCLLYTSPSPRDGW